MKSFVKKSLAVFLVFMMLSLPLTCFAETPEKQYEDYGTYVLLGDSNAAGWSDVEDRDTTFKRVEGSYGALVADELGVEYIPRACIGFRTVEMRYIFEDDFEGDRFLFYSISKEDMDNIYIPQIRKEVAEAGLITLNVGGNDWGSYLGWHIYEEMDKFYAENEEFMLKAKAYLESEGKDENTIESLIDLASLCGALPDILEVLPKAIEIGFTEYFNNWNYMIEDIYALNPDVTLVVLGMFDVTLRAEDVEDDEIEFLKFNIMQKIMDDANKPIIAGAEKYGYIFVDTKGTVCEGVHPSNDGHRFIADKILEALPDANFPYTDVEKNTDEYDAIEYMYRNDIMDGVSLTEFGCASPLTKTQLSDAIYNAFETQGLVDVSNPDATVTKGELIDCAFETVKKNSDSILVTLKALAYTLKIVFKDYSILDSAVTRGEAAIILRTYINFNK